MKILTFLSVTVDNGRQKCYNIKDILQITRCGQKKVKE